jgi:hypothetical protein
MTPEARELLQRAEAVAAAVDLEAGLPASGARLSALVVELLTDGDLAAASPRALWNLLWLAADLTVHVDIYRAMQLFSSLARLYERRFSQLAAHEPAAEMAFDFVFNRREQPLATLRFTDVLALLERILRIDNRFCRRAALHGLGHLKQRALDDDRPKVDAVFDAFSDSSLADYARAARDGQLD